MSGGQMRRIAPRTYWAKRGVFLSPGVVVWAFGRHWRVVPVPRTRWARECHRRDTEAGR